jgi:hypothetical protein
MRRCDAKLLRLFLPCVAMSCAVLLWPANIQADQITLTNGDRITGNIIKSDDKTLVIKSDIAGDVNIKWDGIATITSTQPLHLTLKDGQTIVGAVSTEDSKFVVVTKDTGSVNAPRSEVVAVRNDDEQKTYDATVDRLRNPGLADLWSGQLDTGLSLTRGNSASLTFTLAAKAVRESTRDKIAIYMTDVYGVNDNTEPSQTVANEIRGGVRADININSKVFAFGLTDFDSNALQHLDLQNDIGGGAGYHAYKSKITTFDLSGGVSYNQEYFSQYHITTTTVPPTTTFFPSSTRKNAEAILGEQLDTKIGGRTTFSESFTYNPGFGSGNGYRFTFNSGAATKMNNWLAWQVTFNDGYLSNPPFGIKSNDLLLSTGLRVTLGKTTP